MFVLIQEKERKARRKGKPMQSEETSSSYPAEEEEMEGSGASGNEEEAPEDGEGMAPDSEEKDKRSVVDVLLYTVPVIWGKIFHVYASTCRNVTHLARLRGETEVHVVLQHAITE